MRATNQVIVRMWTADGYHKDVALLDHEQIRMMENRVSEPTAVMLTGGGYAPSVVIDPKDFPEAVKFQVIVKEYQR